MRRSTMLALAAGVLCAAAAALGDTLYVWTNSLTDGPGTAWTNAFRTIQAAVDAAANTGDLVLVTNGVYDSGGAVIPGHSLTNRVSITNAITVESVSGPSNTFIVGAAPIGDGAVRCAYLANGALLRGFTLTNGHTRALGYPYQNTSGGGAFLDGSGGGTNGGAPVFAGPTLSNCVLVGNAAAAYGGGVYLNGGGVVHGCRICVNQAGDEGGGVQTDQGGSVVNSEIVGNVATNYGGGISFDSDGVVVGCSIVSNSAEYGGGVYCWIGGLAEQSGIWGNLAYDEGGGALIDSGGTLRSCGISNNTAATYGGGMGVWYDGLYEGCTVVSNRAVYGGGAYVFVAGMVSNCTLRGNFASDEGGGTLIEDGGTVRGCAVSNSLATHYGGGCAVWNGGLYRDCTVVGNRARWGGGVYLYAGGTVSNCVIRGNDANEEGGGVLTAEGGDAFSCMVFDNSASNYGGGFIAWYAGRFAQSMACSNKAEYGGGVYCFEGGIVQNCTVVRNVATAADPGGGGIYCEDGGAIWNTISYLNAASGGGTNWAIEGSGMSCAYSCTEPDPGGASNIVSDPLFADTAGADYRLSAASPCIDTGNNAYVPSGPDLHGTPRPLDGDTNGTAVADMGCYEYLNRAGDSDGDTMSDGFEDDYGLDPTDASDATGNLDGDPYSNAEEYIADTDPTDSNDYFRIAGISAPSPITVTFEASSNRLYTMYACSNLLSGLWTNVPGAGPRKGGGGGDSMQDTNVPSKGPFYRLAVGLP